MSFEPIQFTYTPPATVESVVPAAVGIRTAVAGNPLDPETIAVASNAAQLLNTVADLKASSQYLQSLIQAVCSSMGILLNFAGDPELSESLQRIYGSPTPPAGISVAMYANLVAAEFGILRTDIVLANSNSSLQASPYQRADLQRATKTFEDAMCTTGDFANQLPLLLRELQGNDLMYDSLTQALQGYGILQGSSYAAQPASVQPAAGDYVNSQASNPFDLSALGGVAGTTAPPRLDVSAELTATLGTRLKTQTSIYGQMYNVVASVTGTLSAINADLTLMNQVITAKALAAVDTVMALIAACKGLQALFHKPSLAGIKDTLTMMLIPRLVAELSPMTCLLDRMVQRITAPVTALLQQADGAIAALAGIEHNLAYLVEPSGLTGVIRNRIEKKPAAPAVHDNQQIKDALTDTDQGIRHLIGYTQWGVNEINAKSQQIRKTLMQAMDRAQQGSQDRLATLISLKQLANVMGVVENAILQTRGTPSTAASVVGGITASVESLPVPSTSVANTLAAGGAQLLNVSTPLPLKF